MYHRVRKKMTRFIFSAILLLVHPLITSSNTLEKTTTILTSPEDEGLDNHIIDFDEEYTVKFNKQYGAVPWHANDYLKNTHKYSIDRNTDKNKDTNVSYNPNYRKPNNTNVRYDPHNTRGSSSIRETTTENIKVIPIKLSSTTESALESIIESTTEHDLTVIPLSTTNKIPNIKTEQAVTLPTITENKVSSNISETTTNLNLELTSADTESSEISTTTWEPLHLIADLNITDIKNATTPSNEKLAKVMNIETNTKNVSLVHNTSKETNNTTVFETERIDIVKGNKTATENTTEVINSTDVEKSKERYIIANDSKDEDADVPVFTELDTEFFEDIPDDYYDSKDVIPTSTPKTDAFSVLFGLAGSVVESVVESVAEKVVPKSIYDLFKRMQKQNEALEAERLRSREENGGIGQFGRGILKSLSTGLSKPLSQLMAGVKEAGSLDTDRGFVGNVASSVTSVANAANTYLEAFKDKVQAIYPGTVWCGDGHSAQARSSSELGLFFFTDTCCRQHDACKLYIRAGETKYGLTNTGLFTRSHCSCDVKFRACLRRTSSLVSAQIGLTYFNVLGPQCFRRAHPIVKCNRRTRITGQKCEEYELDYSKPRMWQWFDNETF